MTDSSTTLEPPHVHAEPQHHTCRAVPPEPHRFIGVMWLSFLMAGVATGAFFSLIDPYALAPCVPFPEVGRMTAYSIGFLAFWALTASTGFLTSYTLIPRRVRHAASR